MTGSLFGKSFWNIIFWDIMSLIGLFNAVSAFDLDYHIAWKIVFIAVEVMNLSFFVAAIVKWFNENFERKRI